MFYSWKTFHSVHNAAVPGERIVRPRGVKCDVPSTVQILVFVKHLLGKYRTSRTAMRQFVVSRITFFFSSRCFMALFNIDLFQMQGFRKLIG